MPAVTTYQEALKIFKNVHPELNTTETGLQDNDDFLIGLVKDNGTSYYVNKHDGRIWTHGGLPNSWKNDAMRVVG